MEPLSLSHFTLSLVSWPDPSVFQSSQLSYHLLLKQSQLFGIRGVFINENHVRPSYSYKIVCLYSKIQKYFTRVILNDCFWLTLISLWFNMDSIRSTNFPMNTPSDPIKPSFVLSLSQFWTFTKNVVNCIIDPTTPSAFRLILWLVNLSIIIIIIIRIIVITINIIIVILQDIASLIYETIY